MTCKTGSVFQVIHSESNIINKLFGITYLLIWLYLIFLQRKVKESSRTFMISQTILSSSCSVKSSKVFALLTIKNQWICNDPHREILETSEEKRVEWNETQFDEYLMPYYRLKPELKRELCWINIRVYCLLLRQRMLLFNCRWWREDELRTFSFVNKFAFSLALVLFHLPWSKFWALSKRIKWPNKKNSSLANRN